MLGQWHTVPQFYFKKGVSPISNNYTGELVGIQIGLEFLSELDSIQNRHIHILIDCQSAIKTAFGNQLPKNKIDIVFDIKSSLGKVTKGKMKLMCIGYRTIKRLKGTNWLMNRPKKLLQR